MSDSSEDLLALVSAYLYDQCTMIIEGGQDLRAGANVVHTLRVAVRRLRSTLRTCGELFDVPRSHQLEAELVWWAGLLGEVRDTDILTARLDDAVRSLPAEVVLGPITSRIVGELSTRRADQWAAVEQALGSDRYHDLLAEIRLWRSETPSIPAVRQNATKINIYLKNAGKKADRRLSAAARSAALGEPDAALLLHRARKAAKRHRYLAELAEPVVGARAHKIIIRRRQLQDLLGGYQDSVVSADFLRRLGAEAGAVDGHNGFTYGVLYAGEIHTQAQICAEFTGLYPAAADDATRARTKFDHLAETR